MMPERSKHIKFLSIKQIGRLKDLSLFPVNFDIQLTLSVCRLSYLCHEMSVCLVVKYAKQKRGRLEGVETDR